jgi:hypothetical protein
MSRMLENYVDLLAASNNERLRMNNYKRLISAQMDPHYNRLKGNAALTEPKPEQEMRF